MKNKSFILLIGIILITTLIASLTDTVAVFAEPAAGADGTKAEAPQVSAATAVVIEQTTGKVLYEKNAKQRAYPASITKIATALLAIESGSLDRKFKIPGSAIGVEGSSIYLAAGERLSLRDLVYGLMLRSGNDAALAISCLVDRSTEEFVTKMNLRTQEIGAVDTHFINPNGLYDDNHYTTAYDMAIIAREAMKNPEFRTIVGARSWVADRGEGKFNHFYNKNKVIFDYPGGTGVKIGYTIRSGRTLVASAERDGMELICVVMNAPDWFNDSYKLMDYAFDNFGMNVIISAQSKIKAVPVREGDKDHVFVGPKNQIVLPALKGEDLKLELVYRLPVFTHPFIRRWQEAGSIELYHDGELLCSHPLYYLEDIEYRHSSNFPRIFL